MPAAAAIAAEAAAMARGATGSAAQSEPSLGVYSGSLESIEADTMGAWQPTEAPEAERVRPRRGSWRCGNQNVMTGRNDWPDGVARIAEGTSLAGVTGAGSGGGAGGVSGSSSGSGSHTAGAGCDPTFCSDAAVNCMQYADCAANPGPVSYTHLTLPTKA